jgi:hypothetical protein
MPIDIGPWISGVTIGLCVVAFISWIYHKLKSQ